MEGGAAGPDWSDDVYASLGAERCGARVHEESARRSKERNIHDVVGAVSVVS